MERLRTIRAAISDRIGAPRFPHAVAGFLTLVVLVVLIAPRPLPRPQPSATPGPSATTSPSHGPTPAPSQTADPWGALHLPPYDAPADLTAIDIDASGVGMTSGFVLRSRTATPAAALAAGLTADPRIEFTVQPGASATEAHLVPSKALLPGTRYRFRLTDPAGALVGTWTYRTEQPLHVVGTLPGDHTTDVPTDTGIEINFDQDGATDLAAHFSIEPAVEGSFQTVGRTVVFSPRQRLAPSTVYRVAITAGVTMTGSEQVLEQPAAFAFETSGPDTGDAWDIGLGRTIMEASPREPAIFGVDLSFNDQVGPPRVVPLQVFRLPTIDAARDAAQRLATSNDWATYVGDDLVPTAGLERVLDLKLAPEGVEAQYYFVLRLPRALPVGWYLIVVPRGGHDRQAVLQVTDLAGWAMTSETRTVAWVHDLATGNPVSGARLVGPDGGVAASTDDAGLIDIATPAGLRPAATDFYASAPITIGTVVAPDGRRLLLALGDPTRSVAYAWERNSAGGPRTGSDRWWLLLSTDRTLYRPTDVVHAWGLIRARDDGTVPATVEVRIRTTDSSDVAGPWLARATVDPSARGAWAVDLPISGLPYGGYLLDVAVGGTVATSTWISVSDIRKPAYRLDVTTDRRAFIEGEKVTVHGRAVFFDGTAAPGLELRAEAFDGSSTATTDATGTVVYTLTTHADTRTDYSVNTIGIAPAAPEEGQISGGAEVVVFPSSAWLATSAIVDGERVVLTGRISAVDLAAVERQFVTNGWPQDPAGAALAGRTITVKVVELVAVRRQIGTSYDFIEKKVVPIYETTETRRTAGTYTTTSAADGAIALRIGVPSAQDNYELTVTARDDAGRVATAIVYASIPEGAPTPTSTLTRPYLESAAYCGYLTEYAGVDESVPLTVHDGNGEVSSSGQYLFIVAARGVREAVLQSSPTFERTFGVGDLPNLSVLAIRFGPGGYAVTNEVAINAKSDSRALTVTLDSDRSRYAPGQTATISVHTTGPDGTPVAADVVVRGVDEKLFEIGGALDVDALGMLLQPVGDGILQSATTHQLPTPSSGDGCGDTTGGGRDDFRDTALFRLTSTGADGRGSVTFTLPDDITSWHVSATAIDGQLRVGDGSVLVPVGLPFFADAILAPEFLAGEQPVLRIRSEGDDLVAGDRVRYSVASPSILLATTVVEADAFAAASVPLPALPLGVHDITIEATVIGVPRLHDALVRRITVRASRIEISKSVTVTAADAASTGGSGLTTYVITDAGRGSLLPAIWDMSAGGGARFDRALAAEMARNTLEEVFGVDPSALPPSRFQASTWERNGIALLPYSSPDLELTALAAIVAPDLIDHPTAAQGLADAGQSNPSRERQIVVLAGRAGLGDDVLPALSEFDRSGLSVRETLWLALAFMASGDENTARSVERELLDRYGEELGPWVRLKAGVSIDDTVHASSLLLLVAAGVGDPVAGRLLAYVRENRVPTFLSVLHEAGAIGWMLERLPRDQARFAWTVDGARTEETLDAGAARSLTLTESQRAGLRIETLAGSVAIVASWRGAPATGDMPAGDVVSITRTISPAGTAGVDRIVRVTLDLRFHSQAPAGCYDLTDTTPSGLAPLAWAPGWDDEIGSGRNWYPWAVDGQRISWCIEPRTSRPTTVSYAARVVSPGTFTWEPAIVQMAAAPGIGDSTGAVTYTIR